jgi:aspartyl-tRNA(Asn)/glutamyl-tRNA(Gln) amidotransferase subunit B
LLELVTDPVFRDPAECSAFLTTLRRLVRYLGISGADMEKGQLRCDANVSLRPAGQDAFGTKTEIKNLNSIKGVERGLRAEIARQTAALDGGERIEQATLLYDVERDRLAVMRSKEHAHDYRYFPEPDLPVLRVSQQWIEEARGVLPELPWMRTARMAESFAIPEYDAGVLSDQREVADYYEAVARAVDPKLTSNWMMTEVLRVLKERAWTIDAWERRVPVERFTEFLARIEKKELPGPLAKQVFAWLADEDGGVDEILARHGVQVQGSADELRPLVRDVIAEHADPVKQYLAGKTATLGFLVGQVMKRSGGQAVPQVVKQLLEEELKHHAEDP